MRLELNTLDKHVGEQRVVEKFLWLPTVINSEWRWLEHATIVQEVVLYDVGGSMEWGRFKACWGNKDWADKVEVI
jgi:hypothetical protein